MFKATIRWLAAYVVASLIAGLVFAALSTLVTAGCGSPDSCADGFSWARAREGFDLILALSTGLAATPYLALLGFLPALILSAVPEALGVRPSALRYGIAGLLASLVFVAVIHWPLTNLDAALGDVFLLAYVGAAVAGAYALGAMRQWVMRPRPNWRDQLPKTSR